MIQKPVETAANTAAKPAARSARRPAVKVAAGKARANVVKKLLKNMEKKLKGQDVKASLADYIRLVQLQKELDDDAPREIKVTWVETGTETTEPMKPDGPEPAGPKTGETIPKPISESGE